MNTDPQIEYNDFISIKIFVMVYYVKVREGRVTALELLSIENRNVFL